MKSVTSEYRMKYNLDTKSRKSECDGDSYKIEGQPGMWVKLLKDNSKNKELEIRQQIELGGGYGSPREVVYSGRAKFAGYVYEVEESDCDPVPDPDRTTDSDTGLKSLKTDYMQTNIFKICLSSGFGILLSVLNIKVLYYVYIGFLLNSFPEEVASGSSMLSCSGATGILGGIALMILFGLHFIEQMEGILFVILEGVAFLLGILLVDFIITVLVCSFLGIVSLLKAVLPVVITIGIVIMLVKMLIGR